MAASRLLLAVALFAVLAAASALLSEEPVPLVPGQPERVYLAAQQNGDRIGAYFEINTTLPDNPSSFMFLVARDTTRAPLICYWSTVKTHPSWIGNDPSFSFTQQSNAHRFTPPNSPTLHGLYYVGCYIKPMGTGFQTVSAQFEATVVFYNGTQHTPPNSGTITMSSNLLQSNNTATVPSLNATFSTISIFSEYAFYLEEKGCSYNVLVNELNYVMANMTRFRNVSYQADDVPPEALVTLTDFSPDASVFCLNLVAFNKEGVAQTVWLAQTLYYPHQRDGIEPEKVNPRKWGASVWVPLILTCLLFVCAPVGIIIHRIWLARRRAQKKAASGLLLSEYQQQQQLGIN